jgi:hypothetical protein
MAYERLPIAGLRQLTAVETNESVDEETTELPPLGRAGDAPIRAQHETGDAGRIEILVDHLAEIDCFLGQLHVGADDRDRLVTESTDKRDRRVVGRSRTRCRE